MQSCCMRLSVAAIRNQSYFLVAYDHSASLNVDCQLIRVCRAAPCTE